MPYVKTETKRDEHLTNALNLNKALPGRLSAIGSSFSDFKIEIFTMKEAEFQKVAHRRPLFIFNDLTPPTIFFRNFNIFIFDY